MTLLHQDQRIPAVARDVDIESAFKFFQCLQREFGVERKVFDHQDDFFGSIVCLGHCTVWLPVNRFVGVLLVVGIINTV